MIGYLLSWLPTVLVLLVAWLIVMFVCAIFLRTVVQTNEVHIVQSRRRTTSYGKDQPAGNTYYRWPSWAPRIGIRVITFPVSVFSIALDDYSAYDKGRVPFVIDILAFFRIENSNVAAQRVSSFKELESQLHGILQGASRSILAGHPIEEILEKRAEYGQAFTDATNTQLEAWGVTNVKNVELMDIRDASDSHVIANIMAVKKSSVERDSRVAVAANMQAAKTAELDAMRAVQVREQEVAETVAVRAAAKDQAVGIAGQQAQQAVKEQEKTTAERSMAVVQVQNVRKAEIERDVQVVAAEQEKRVAIVHAEGEKAKTVTIAEGQLSAAQLNAQAIEAQGKAKGAADTAVLMAPITTQITLAKEIGTNAEYQKYLVTVRQIEAGQVVGIEQAKALAEANIKVIANAGNVIEGVKSAMDLFTPKGGLQVGAALEAFGNTEVGERVLAAVARPNGAGKEA